MSSKQNWELKIDPQIYKFLSRIPKDFSKKVLNVIYSLSLDPFAGDIQKIRGERNSWRRRAGNYRIFYDIKTDEKTIEVTRVERRTSKTY